MPKKKPARPKPSTSIARSSADEDLEAGRDDIEALLDGRRRHGCGRSGHSRGDEPTVSSSH